MERISKAWELDLSKVYEGYMYSPVIVFAENRAKAKYAMLSKARYEGVCNRDDKEFTYIDIPVFRNKEHDRYMFEGKEMNLSDIKERQNKRKRNDGLYKLMKDNPNGYAYIKKGGYYYRDNNCGYTEYLSQAGVYPIDEAVREVAGCDVRDFMDVILINKDDHNNMIKEAISFLEKRLI